MAAVLLLVVAISVISVAYVTYLTPLTTHPSISPLPDVMGTFIPQSTTSYLVIYNNEGHPLEVSAVLSNQSGAVTTCGGYVLSTRYGVLESGTVDLTRIELPPKDLVYVVCDGYYDSAQVRTAGGSIPVEQRSTFYVQPPPYVEEPQRTYYVPPPGGTPCPITYMVPFTVFSTTDRTNVRIVAKWEDSDPIKDFILSQMKYAYVLTGKTGGVLPSSVRKTSLGLVIEFDVPLLNKGANYFFLAVSNESPPEPCVPEPNFPDEVDVPLVSHISEVYPYTNVKAVLGVATVPYYTGYPVATDTTLGLYEEVSQYIENNKPDLAKNVIDSYGLEQQGFPVSPSSYIYSIATYTTVTLPDKYVRGVAPSLEIGFYTAWAAAVGVGSTHRSYYRYGEPKHWNAVYTMLLNETKTTLVIAMGSAAGFDFAFTVKYVLSAGGRSPTSPGKNCKYVDVKGTGSTIANYALPIDLSKVGNTSVAPYTTSMAPLPYWSDGHYLYVKLDVPPDGARIVLCQKNHEPAPEDTFKYWEDFSTDDDILIGTSANMIGTTVSDGVLYLTNKSTSSWRANDGAWVWLDWREKFQHPLHIHFTVTVVKPGVGFAVLLYRDSPESWLPSRATTLGVGEIKQVGWFYRTEYPDAVGIEFRKSYYGGWAVSFMRYIRPSSRFTIARNSSVDIPLNQPVPIDIIYDGNTMKVFINYEQILSVPYPCPYNDGYIMLTSSIFNVPSVIKIDNLFVRWVPFGGDLQYTISGSSG